MCGGLLSHGVGQQVLEVRGACGPLQRRLLATAAHQRALLTAGYTVTAHTLQTPQSLKIAVFTIEKVNNFTNQ